MNNDAMKYKLIKTLNVITSKLAKFQSYNECRAEYFKNDVSKATRKCIYY